VIATQHTASISASSSCRTRVPISSLQRSSTHGTRSYSTPNQTHYAKPPLYGQPLSQTHPHLVRSETPGYLTRGITAAEYEQRRRRLMRGLPEGSRVVCMGAGVRLVTQRESVCRMVMFPFLLGIPWTPEADFFLWVPFRLLSSLWLCWEGQRSCQYAPVFKRICISNLLLLTPHYGKPNLLILLVTSSGNVSRCQCLPPPLT
jgi:hypothetical protein